MVPADNIWNQSGLRCMLKNARASSSCLELCPGGIFRHPLALRHDENQLRSTNCGKPLVLLALGSPPARAYMPHTPEIALSVVTYQRPRSLALVLESIAAQREVEGKIELVVTDDGSSDDTLAVVDAFRQRVNFPVTFVTHSRLGFQAARCRNEGASATSAPYLLFLDGDCVLPPHHVAAHLAHRRPNVVLIGDVCKLDQAASERLTEDTVRRGDFAALDCAAERRRLRKLDLKYRFYNFIRHPTKPRSLRSGDFSIWRDDFRRVNGFDENFCGWGGEDDDLGRRLRRAGIRLQSFLRWTYSYHLWHPRDISRPQIPDAAPNARYVSRKGRLIRCRNGLIKRDWNDLAWQIVGRAAQPQEVLQWIAGRITPQVAGQHSGAARRTAETGNHPEVELLFLPGEGSFSGAADCNVLVALDESPRLQQLAPTAHVLVAPQTLADAPNVLQFPLDQWVQALNAVA